MPFLKVQVIENNEIVEKEFEAKTNFRFERLAEEKYSKDPDGKTVGGFINLYLGLLQYDPLSLVAFWDCALHHYKKDKPTVPQIEDALEKLLEEDEEAPFKVAFKVLDAAGFFKKRVKDIWKELAREEEEQESETPEEKEKRKEREKGTKMMEQRRRELTA